MSSQKTLKNNAFTIDFLLLYSVIYGELRSLVGDLRSLIGELRSLVGELRSLVVSAQDWSSVRQGFESTQIPPPYPQSCLLIEHRTGKSVLKMLPSRMIWG